MSARSFYEDLGIARSESAQDGVPVTCFTCSTTRSRGGADLVAYIDLATGNWRCYRCGRSGGPREAALALGVTPMDAEAALVAHEVPGSQAVGEGPSPTAPGAQVHRSAVAQSNGPEPDDPTDAAVRCEALSREPDILAALADAAEGAGLVGEGPHLKLLYLIAVTRLFARPVSAVIKGPSSAGKSYLIEQMLRFVPDDAAYVLTAMSPKALAYSEEPLEHRLLVVYEAPGMDNEMASYLMRSLLSEGEIRYETVISTSKGLQSLLIHRPGPTGLITTTTAIALHEENETRLISIPVTDSPDQTKAIMRAAAAGPREPLDLTPWLALQQRLAALSRSDVIVPFGLELADAIPPVAVRLRRDFKTLLTLIEAHALLHAARRDRDATGAVVATLQDYAAVRELVLELMAEGLEQSVPPTIRATVDAVAGLPSDSKGSVTVAQVAKALKLDRSAALRRVQGAINLGFLNNINDKVGPGHALKLVVGDPLPNEQHVLPTPGELEDLCTCAATAKGDGTSQPPSDPEAAAPAHTANFLEISDADLDRWEAFATDPGERQTETPAEGERHPPS